MSEGYKSFVIVNPNSANGSTGRHWPSIKDKLTDSLGTFDFKLTTRCGEATELAREACAKDYEMVIAVGGDGTNNEIINGFFDGERRIDPEMNFGFICSGTGGDYRKTFGWDTSVEKAIERLVGRETRPVDIGRFTYIDHKDKERLGYFVNIASFGIGGLVDYYINNSSKALGGKLSFLLNTVKAMWNYNNKPVKITVDDDDSLELDIYSVAVANGQYFGGGMHMAPEAKPDDGLFDIVVMKAFSKLEILTKGRLIYKGTHVNLPEVISMRGKKVTATSNEEVLIDIDGEHLGRLNCTFENLHQEIKLKI